MVMGMMNLSKKREKRKKRLMGREEFEGFTS
jgi:hypothetical protein